LPARNVTAQSDSPKITEGDETFGEAGTRVLHIGRFDSASSSVDQIGGRSSEHGLDQSVQHGVAPNASVGQAKTCRALSPSATAYLLGDVARK